MAATAAKGATECARPQVGRGRRAGGDHPPDHEGEGPCRQASCETQARLLRRRDRWDAQKHRETRFPCAGPNRLWTTDIDEVSVPAGRGRPSPVADCFVDMRTERSWSTSPDAEFLNTMPGAAASKLQEAEHPASHSDRGRHRRRPGWIERYERYGTIRSMPKKGGSPGNLAMEGFFGRLKVEFFYERDWLGWPIDRFMDALDEYTHWHNKEKIKLSLGGMSPIQYRKPLGLAAWISGRRNVSMPVPPSAPMLQLSAATRWALGRLSARVPWWLPMSLRMRLCWAFPPSARAGFANAGSFSAGVWRARNAGEGTKRPKSA